MNDWKPLRRMRRNRSSAAIREMVAETRVRVEDLIQPLFVRAGDGDAEEVESMPNVVRHTTKGLLETCGRLTGSGIRAIALFPVIARVLKDPTGRHALSDDNVLFRAIRSVKDEFPDLLVITDVALDPYTDHGHDGLLNRDGTDVENDPTVEVLCKLAVKQAAAGADIVAPSDMMDGRVRAIRQVLDANGYQRRAVLAYTAKYNSAFYGPFRDAVRSSAVAGSKMLSKATYQMNPANAREALLELELDEDEGADIVMVKPAGAYLDIIHRIREQTDLPVAAYQVSGEYAQIHAAAQLGWLDYKKARDESLLAIKRAGADMILTYFAAEVAEALSA